MSIAVVGVDTHDVMSDCQTQWLLVVVCVQAVPPAVAHQPGTGGGGAQGQCPTCQL